MEINIEALKVDLEYWEWVAPDWADCYVLSEKYSGFGKVTEFGWETPETSWLKGEFGIEVIQKPVFEESAQFIEAAIKQSFTSELKDLLKRYDATIRTQVDTGFESSIEVVLSAPHKTRGKMVVNFGSVIYGSLDEETD